MSLLKRTVAFALVVACSSCATAKFQPGKPVTHGGPFDTYLQDGERVSQEDVRDYLMTLPETEYKAKASNTWKYIAIAPGFSGAFLIGYNLFDKNRTSDTGLWIGVGLTAIGAACGIYSDALLTSAADTYNQKVAGKKTGALRISPLLETTPAAPPRAGLQLAFDW